MVDHRLNTGNSGTLIIRDNGSSVEFLIENRGSQTFANGKSWSGNVGYGVGGTFSIGKSQTISLGAWHVGSSMTVSFTMGATGTSGLGGPTTISAWVNRARQPDAPTTLGFSNIGHTTVRYQFSGNWDGGSPIREWQVSFGTNGSAIEGAGNNKYGSNGTIDFSGLIPGQLYYAWSRGRNDLGWSGWSGGSSVRLLSGVKIKVNGEWKNAIAFVKDGGVWKATEPFMKDADVWKRTQA